jgi:hypothetical protein
MAEGQEKRSLILIGLCIALILPELRLPQLVAHATGLRLPWVRETFFWAYAAILLVYVLAAERRPLPSIGWEPPTWRTLAWGACAAVIMVIGIGLIYVKSFPCST